MRSIPSVPPRGAAPCAVPVGPVDRAFRLLGEREGAPVEDSVRISDHSGRGNHLTKVTIPGGPADALIWSDEHHPVRPGHGSLSFHTWWRAAVVNDGRHTTMYVDGCPVARNPSAPAGGLTTLGLPWLLGGYEYGGKIDQIMYGRIGDVRVVDRALPVCDFMSS
ncbi:LamG-like jellyroll fold domain-containing protein [Streptomyces rapamycinicus]|uniref:LamG-like jellyroll fold domain-containing protein n=2 Tax=Streptomyces rapamycinicus TaxID=1226757 RepID=A0A0A0N8K0_STRRN|nr:hypothetical protein M271_03665 [Streptomyces rapamycinicus NRRL 5491]MBB4779828.1 hypothetical protein [Streptomyces rapamycinicus]RLV75515.1 hypothetical protein D3C57_139855 [Streptomyces rapamycinicus NRRL 5491]